MTPEQQARLAQLQQQYSGDLPQFRERTGNSLPDSQYRMLMQAYNQYRAQGGQADFQDFGTQYVLGGGLLSAGDPTQFRPYEPQTNPQTQSGGFPGGGTVNTGVTENGNMGGTGTFGGGQFTGGATVNGGAPYIPPPTQLPGPTELPGGPSPGGIGVGGETVGGGPLPNSPYPPAQQPQQPPGLNASTLAAFGYMMGPNGEILPQMLQGGWSPYQNQGTSGGQAGYNAALQDPLQLQQLVYNPTQGGYQWYQPPAQQGQQGQQPGTYQPGPQMPVPGGNGGNNGGTGGYFEQMRGGQAPRVNYEGLLGGGQQALPPALAGLLG